MTVIDAGIATPERPIGVAVICHGFPGTNLNVPLAKALSLRGYRVVLFRYAGVDGTPGTWSFDRSAADCAAMLRDARARHGSPVVAIGYSMGGLHVLRALHDDASLCDALVLLGPALSLASLREHFAARGDSPERFMTDARDLLTGGSDARIAEYRALEREDQPLSFARTLALPVLLVHGTSDTVVPAEDIRTAVATFVDATALIVNDDHDYARTAPLIADAIAALAARAVVRS